MSNNTKVRASDHESYGVYTLISILVPPAGLIMGAIMLTKDELVDKKLGEHAIVCSIFGIILGVILWSVLLTVNTTSELPLTNGY